jgi:hypothetical protein
VIFDLGARATRRRFLRGGLAVSGLVLLSPRRALADGFLDAAAGIEAGFLARSYRAGETAELFLDTPSRTLVAQVFAREPGHPRRGARRDAPPPFAATEARRIHWPRGAGILHLDVGRWPTGLYFVSLRDADGRTGSAPLVVRPSRLGGARTLVVMPTNTWGAYNFRDDATWYANPLVHEVDLTRPFLDGLPPHFDDYDRGFQRWFSRSGFEADVVADDDLEEFASGEQLDRLYDMIVFAGHEEYVTEHTYDIVERFQQLGGNLLFLSANNFFYKVVKQGSVIQGRWRWRDLGRPEARMIGSQYLDWYQGIYRNRPFVVADTKAARWLFEGTGVTDGSTFGTYGIEIDACCDDSPPGVQVLATIPDIFGPGQTAQMTHYRTPGGAQVFDAGVLNFSGTADQPIPGQIVSNAWKRLQSRG